MFLRYVLFIVILVMSLNAKSALITANFTSTASSGPFVGSLATGTFTYDDSLLSGTGEEILDTTDGLTVEVTVFGQTFTDTDDIAKAGTWDELPELVFFDGTATFLDFFVSEIIFEEGLFGEPDYAIQPNVRDINLEGVSGFGSYTLNSVGVNTYDGNFEVNAVPVPAAAWLFGSGLIALISITRRKQA